VVHENKHVNKNNVDSWWI